MAAELATTTTATTTPTAPALFEDISTMAGGSLDMRGEGMLSWGGEDFTDGSFDWLTWFMQESSLPMGG